MIEIIQARMFLSLGVELKKRRAMERPPPKKVS